MCKTYLINGQETSFNRDKSVVELLPIKDMNNIDLCSFSTESKCATCGTDFEQNTTGRKKEYCSLNCQELNKYLSAFENKFLKIKTMDKQSIKNIRSRLFSLANLTNSKNKRTFK